MLQVILMGKGRVEARPFRSRVFLEFGSELRIWIPFADHFAYPDVLLLVLHCKVNKCLVITIPELFRDVLQQVDEHPSNPGFEAKNIPQASGALRIFKQEFHDGNPIIRILIDGSFSKISQLFSPKASHCSP